VAFSDAGWAIVEPVEAGGVEYTLTAELNGYDLESHPVTLTVLDPDNSLPVPPGPGEGPHSLSGTIFTLDGALLTDASDLIAEVDILSNGAGARDPLRQHMYGVFEAGAASTWLLPHDAGHCSHPPESPHPSTLAWIESQASVSGGEASAMISYPEPNHR